MIIDIPDIWIRNILRPLFVVTVVLTAFLVSSYIVIAWLKMPRITENRRASFSQSLIHDIPLYTRSPSQPGLMTLYGPAFPVGYAPNLFGKTPAQVVRISYALHLFYIYFPLLLAAHTYFLLGLGTRAIKNAFSPKFLVATLLLSSCIAALVTVLPEMQDLVFTFHVDSMILACHIVSGCLLALAVQRHSTILALLASLIVCVSVFGKITSLALVVAPILPLFYFDRKLFLLYCSSTLALLAAISMVCLAIYGKQTLLENMATISLRHAPKHELALRDFSFYDQVHHMEVPLKTRLKAMVKATELQIGSILGLTAAALLAASLVYKQCPKQSNGNTATVPSELLLPIFLVSIALFSCPGGILGFSKYGGGISGLCNYVVPFWVSIALCLFHIAKSLQSRASIASALITFIMASAVLSPLLIARAISMLERPPVNLNQNYTALIRHPDKLFFPDDPLSHILAEGKYYFDLDVARCFSLAGVPFKNEALRSLVGDRRVIYDVSNRDVNTLPSTVQYIEEIFPAHQIDADIPAAEATLKRSE